MSELDTRKLEIAYPNLSPKLSTHNSAESLSSEILLGCWKEKVEWLINQSKGGAWLSKIYESEASKAEANVYGGGLRRHGDSTVIAEIIARITNGQSIKILELGAGRSFGNSHLGRPWLSRIASLSFGRLVDITVSDIIGANALIPNFESRNFNLNVACRVDYTRLPLYFEAQQFDLIFSRHLFPGASDLLPHILESSKYVAAKGAAIILNHDTHTANVSSTFISGNCQHDPKLVQKIEQEISSLSIPTDLSDYY